MKTIVIYTREDGKYFGYIAGLNIFTTGWDTLEECKKDIAEELTGGRVLTSEDVTKDMREYFTDDETLENVIDIVITDI